MLEFREAFWDLYRPGCSEHLIVRKIRKLPVFIKELSYVACDNDKIVGNIIYSRARIISEDSLEHEVLCMGPLGVLPHYQKRGIGSRLMAETLKKASELGYKAVIIFGNPKYYERFGFKNAKELQKGSLTGLNGKFHADKVFEIKDDELEEFEKGFPYKKKHVTDTQLK